MQPLCNPEISFSAKRFENIHAVKDFCIDAADFEANLKQYIAEEMEELHCCTCWWLLKKEAFGTKGVTLLLHQIITQVCVGMTDPSKLFNVFKCGLVKYCTATQETT